MRFGSDIQPLVYIQVHPYCRCQFDSLQSCGRPSLTAAFIKVHLFRLSLQSVLMEEDSQPMMLLQERDLEDHSMSLFRTNKIIKGTLVRKMSGEGGANELFWFPQNDPSCCDLWPCRLTGYVRGRQRQDSSSSSPLAVVEEATLVHLLPVACGCDRLDDSWKQNQLLGRVPSDPTVPAIDVRNAHNPSTVAEWKLKLRLLLAEPVLVGTTSDALFMFRERKRAARDRRRGIRFALRRGKDTSQIIGKGEEGSEQGQSPTGCSTERLPFRNGGLLLHSPHHGVGKTVLTETIALELGAVVYKIRAGSLISRYGVQSDAALQCIIHSLAVESAMQHSPVCVILDGLDAFLPFRTTLGDAANPVLQGMLSYIQTLTKSIEQRQEIPFPVNSPLYNVNGKNGIVLKAGFAVVAIMTCADRQVPKLSPSIGLYRLPNLTSETRLSAFRSAFEDAGLTLSQKSHERLPILAASATWARGACFKRLAAMARAALDLNISLSTPVASIPPTVIEEVFANEGKREDGTVNIRFAPEAPSPAEGGDLFDSVGGTEDAKAALEDALALDQHRRGLLSSFGLSLPTGMLLYGPPGCGKTLLAKAVAGLLRVNGPKSTAIGGAFISLNSSDLIRSTVGTGEKTLVSSFEEARLNSPAVIFIDEFQALFVERSSEGTGRLSSTLLQCMDDVKRWAQVERQAGAQKSDRVLVIAATNTPWMVDKAFLRPGRFDRSVCVDLPNLQDRHAILSIHIRHMQTALSDSEIRQLATKSAAYSGADLAALCRSAAVRCLLVGSTKVESSHFEQILDEGFQSSTDPSLLRKIREWAP